MEKMEEDKTTSAPDLTGANRSSKDQRVFEEMDWDLHFDRVFASDDKIQPTINNVFRWKGEAKEVFISGSYDNWSSQLPLVKTESEFYTIKPLSQGCHHYKFLVDGEWKVHDLETTSNMEGEEVNVVTVRGADNDVFIALAKDDARTANLSKLHFKTGWTQELPARGLGYGFLRSGPNLLPPQLSNTVLNDEVQAKCDPTILPLPTHVVLNHLYTLSIKDGVLVMASTYRYRKKYITTVIYKPI